MCSNATYFFVWLKVNSGCPQGWSVWSTTWVVHKALVPGAQPGDKKFQHTKPVMCQMCTYLTIVYWQTDIFQFMYISTE